jgi:hypothetical protein
MLQLGSENLLLVLHANMCLESENLNAHNLPLHAQVIGLYGRAQLYRGVNKAHDQVVTIIAVFLPENSTYFTQVLGKPSFKANVPIDLQC